MIIHAINVPSDSTVYIQCSLVNSTQKSNICKCRLAYRVLRVHIHLGHYEKSFRVVSRNPLQLIESIAKYKKQLNAETQKLS